jgi:ABC-type transporter Mla maintaining outer membrane lipid asymmetry ATPase subunit MlaF
VIGPSGSGKTVVLNFLLAQARRFDPRIVFFDKDRGASCSYGPAADATMCCARASRPD